MLFRDFCGTFSEILRNMSLIIAFHNIRNPISQREIDHLLKRILDFTFCNLQELTTTRIN